MDTPYVVVILALVTMLFALVFALIGQRQIENRKDDPKAPKSTLAADKVSDGKPADI